LAKLNLDKAKGDAVIYVSDNESWVDSHRWGSGTAMIGEWLTFKKRNPKAKLVCIDLTPRSNSQVKEHKDILQVGGFSDQVFDVVASFIEHGDDKNHWVKLIEDVSLDG
jgi:60 kDa SS-A/Ro ribonucleoprotein